MLIHSLGIFRTTYQSQSTIFFFNFSGKQPTDISRLMEGAAGVQYERKEQFVIE